MKAIPGSQKQQKRRTEILEMLEDEKYVSVSALSSYFGVSEVTIRKDLDVLEEIDLVKRNHGGVRKPNKTKASLDYNSKKKLHSAEKAKIAEAATDLIHDGDSVIINVGSTSAFVCDEIKKRKKAIVITNAMPVLLEFADCKNVTVFFLGGRYDNDFQITVGEGVEDQLSKYTADVLIMGIDGIDVYAGATSYNHLEDSIMRKMILQAKHRIMVADHSKFGRVAFAHITDLNAFDTLITDDYADNREYYEKIRAMGVNVITV